ncbi:MAG: oligoendopeptidase F [Lachnospiraceae bacterium]|nr:oligoendopeptidase F [Lachnospiraceae bacterium]
MAKVVLRKRSEIPSEYKWCLEDMFSSDEAWEQEYELVLQKAEAMKAFCGTLARSGEQLLRFWEADDDLHYYVNRVVVYSNERYHEDTAVAKYQDYAAKADHAVTAASEAEAFAQPEILAIPDEVLAEMYAREPGLERYRRAMDEIRRAREHTLSEAEEKILAMTGEIAKAPDNIFSIFNNADIHFPSIRDLEGNRVSVTNGNFTLLQANRDRSLRKQVYEGFYHTYEQFGHTIAMMYSSQVKVNQFYANARNYPSARAMFLDSGNIPESVYDNLIAVVHKHLPAMYRYVSARKKLLGVEHLHMYDIYVPIVERTEHEYTFEEARDLVLAALEPMGEEYVSIMRSGFESGWVDVYENENKRGGAYSWGAYGTHPYVLLNFQGDLDSVFTLAHEMGHAMHTYYSNANQPITYAEYLIFVAEVASTCNEALLTQYLLNHTEDPGERLYLLNHYLDSFRTTLYRQCMFAEFEHIAHTRQASGETLTQEVLDQIYGDLVKLYYGPDMVVDDEIVHEWMRIPHFYTSYYVYQYATGYSAAIAFSKRILEQGKTAVDAYVDNFLKGGSSADPIDLLRAAGVDMSTETPIEAALNVFENVLEQFLKECK